MNIFVLSGDPSAAAYYHCDKHVVKMILESAQMLSTAHHTHGGGGPYKPVHVNHPCTRWVTASICNYNWLHQLAEALCFQYTERYGKKHACEYVINGDLYPIPERIPIRPRTPFVQCMPDQYKSNNPVHAYRQYYIHDKARFAKWAHTHPPPWWPKEAA